MSGFATVKAVLSGDMLLLMGKSTAAGPPPVRRVTLANITAPRLARGPDSADEPFAWACRERLRKLCAGKRIKFVVVRPGQANRPESCDVTMQDGTNLALTLVQEGLAKLRPGRAEDKRSAYFTQLQEAAANAQAAMLGQWNTAPGTAAAAVRDVKWSVENPKAFLAQVKGKPQQAVVEGVRDGSSLRCILVPSYQVVTFCLAAIQCPRMNYGKRPAASATAAAPVRAAAPPAAPAATAAAPAAAPSVPAPVAGESKGQEEGAGDAATKSYLASAGGSAPAPASGGAPSRTSNAAPFAEMAKHFVEVRLLNADVTLYINGTDRYNNFFGDVQFARGDISLELVKAGLAKMVDWSVAFTTREKASALRQAETAAKTARLRIWKNYTPQVITGRKLFNGIVSEVITGDTFMVRVDDVAPREERKIHLSSTRAPYPGRRDGEGEEPYGRDAKESLRKLLIGRPVSVKVDYQRGPRGAPAAAAAGAGAGGEAGAGAAPAAPTGPTQDYATVRLLSRKGTPNVAGLLISEGLATVIRHGASDDNRASEYDALVAAQLRAESAKKRVHSANPAPPRRVQNLIGNPTKARTFLSFLQRERSHKGVVEYVHGGGRVKLFLPNQNCTMNFALGGLRCPSTARRANNGREARAEEQGGPEAVQFMRDQVLQRDVEVSVDTMDARGCAIGTMWVGAGGKRRDVGVELLARGLGRTMRNVDRLNNGRDLLRAEAAAKDAGKGVWDGFVEEPEAKTGDAAQYKCGITVADVVDGATFTAHKSDEAPQLTSVNAAMAAMKEADGTGPMPVEVKHKKVLAALFNDGSGDQWFRARVHKNVRTNDAGKQCAEVLFLDYGNRDVVTIDRMRPLDPAIGNITPLAHACTLAYIRVQPVSTELGHAAAVYLNELVWGATDLEARVHATDADGRLTVSVTSKSAETPVTVNELLIRAGLARISKSQIRYATPGDAGLVKALKQAQKDAKAAHEGMFRYGDVGDSDDEDVRR